ncbi:MAG TPA: MaoC family dehydratase [Polyangia bacterium]|jgi:acyl dehydratase|nr:MaoC family dehydratase [Polyangia bacterium]
MARFFEDFVIGQTFQTRSYEMTAERIKAFAAQFDPQPFHLDEEAAKDTLFKGLAASGWHTAAVTMKLLVESGLEIAGGTIGGGVGELRWPRPVRPGDVLHLEAEVIETRRSRTRPELGIVTVRLTMVNQDGQAVQISTPALMVPTRAPAAS